MQKLVIIFISLLLFVPVKAKTEPSLYSLSSKSQGAPFDLVVTEIKREANKSFISVPGFNERTAPGSRWLMCVYTDMAVKRGFTYWTVVYPSEDKDVLVLGFTNTPIVTVRGLLGEDYNSERVLGEELIYVERFFSMCGMQRQQ